MRLLLTDYSNPLDAFGETFISLLVEEIINVPGKEITDLGDINIPGIGITTIVNRHG